MSVHTDKGNKGTRKIRSLETVRIEHRKRKAVYVRKDAQSAQKPYTYAKAAQLAQNISSIYVKNIRTPYAQAVHKRTKNPYTYAKAVHKRTQIRISYAKPHTFAQTVCRRLLQSKKQSKASWHATKNKSTYEMVVVGQNK